MKWVEVSLAIGNEQLQQMENAARRSPNSEVCGLLYADAFIPLNNISNHNRSFRANPSDLAYVLATRGEPPAIFHTHPSGDLLPSEADKSEWFYFGSVIVIGALRDERLQLKSYRIITRN